MAKICAMNKSKNVFIVDFLSFERSIKGLYENINVTNDAFSIGTRNHKMKKTKIRS